MMMMMTGMRWKIVELVAMWMQPPAFEGEGRRLVTEEMLCCAAQQTESQIKCSCFGSFIPEISCKVE